MNKKIIYRGTEVEYRLKQQPLARQTILFLHGWGGNSHSFATIEPFFVSKYDCIFVSFPMFQKTDTHSPEVPYMLDDYGEITKKILEAECQQTVHVIAHSFGARVAAKLAKECPALFDKLLLTGAAGIPKRQHLSTKMKILLYKLRRKLFKISEHGRGSEDYRQLTQAGKLTFQNILKEDLRPHIAQVFTPTLLIFGEKDLSTPVAMGKQWTIICKTAKLLIYEKAGHFCFIDRPSRFIIDANNFFEGTESTCF